MTFSMTHNFFEMPPEIFEESDAPDWLVHKENKWWYDDYVKKLEVGENIKSDFRTITRTK
jgi:hypothetical protein